MLLQVGFREHEKCERLKNAMDKNEIEIVHPYCTGLSCNTPVNCKIILALFKPTVDGFTNNLICQRRNISLARLLL